MARHQIEVKHEKLHQYRLISGEDDYFVRKKAQALKALWDEQWAKRVEREKRLSEKATNGEIAAERTEQAKEAIADIHAILEKAFVRNPLTGKVCGKRGHLINPFPSLRFCGNCRPNPT
jgi:hypothetical protein